MPTGGERRRVPLDEGAHEHRVVACVPEQAVETAAQLVHGAGRAGPAFVPELGRRPAAPPWA